MPFQIKAQSPTDSWSVPVAIAGPTLLEILRAQSIPVRSSCSGKGVCSKCRVRVEKGVAPSSVSDKKVFCDLY